MDKLKNIAKLDTDRLKIETPFKDQIHLDIYHLTNFSLLKFSRFSRQNFSTVKRVVAFPFSLAPKPSSPHKKRGLGEYILKQKREKLLYTYR